MTDRDLDRLEGVHPLLVRYVREILGEMREAGHPMFVVEGVRTAKRQAELYAQGRTVMGPIVTYKNGVDEQSKHQAKSDGYGHAVDCAFTDGNPFGATHPWHTYGEAAERRGLTWGGRYPKLVDMPHIELAETDAKQA